MSGYQPSRASTRPSTVERAWTYVTNFEGGFYVGDLGVQTTVGVLMATPPDPVRGLRYLFGVHRALAASGPAYLAALVDEARRAGFEG